MTPDQRLEGERLYSAAVGPRADIYVPKFIGFDTHDTSRISWSWPAFFCTFLWMLYRRMYGYATAYFILMPAIASVLIAAMVIAVPPRLVPWFAGGMYAFVFFVFVPMYANAMYHTTVAKRLVDAQAEAATLDEQVAALQKQGGTSLTSLAIGVVIACAVGIAGIHERLTSQGSLEARQHIGRTIMHSDWLQGHIRSYYWQHGQWPADAAAMDLTGRLEGPYTASVEVRDGRIHFEFGNEAALDLYGKTLVLAPVVNELRIDWICDEEASPGLRAVPTRMWPSTCDRRDLTFD